MAKAVGEIVRYPSSEVIDEGIAILDNIGRSALVGATVGLDVESTSVLRAASTAYIDPETTIEPQRQVEFIRSTLGVLTPGTELPDFEGRQWASLWRRAEVNAGLRFMAAPLMDTMDERQRFVENARDRLPNDFTPHRNLTALRAPDAGTVIADLMEDMSPNGRDTVEREGELFVARYASPWEIQELDEAYRRVLVEEGRQRVAEGFRRDLVESGRTVDEEIAGDIPEAYYKSPLRGGPVDRLTYREDALNAGTALVADNGTVVAFNLMDAQQNALRREESMGELFPRISPVATPETHILGEILRQMADKPDMNMTINALNEAAYVRTRSGELEDHPRYVGTLRFRTDSPIEKPDYGHRIGAYARTWESTRTYMAVRDAVPAFILPARTRVIVL